MEKTQNPSILFIAAHPFLEKSRANRAVVDAIVDLPGLTLRRLYHVYPHFHIHVEREQELLFNHSLLVVQHPLYWYSMPPLLKMWVDETLESGWAYGPGGNQLKGKDFLLSVTAGGPRESYAPAGSNRFPMDSYLIPWNQTAHLCQMRWHAPKIVYDSIRADRSDLQAHAQKVREDLQHYLKNGVLP